MAEIKRRTQRPIIKALGVASAKDLETAKAYEGVADWFLFDAKPPEDGLPVAMVKHLTGRFWTLMQARRHGSWRAA